MKTTFQSDYSSHLVCASRCDGGINCLFYDFRVSCGAYDLRLGIVTAARKYLDAVFYPSFPLHDVLCQTFDRNEKAL